MTANSQHGAMDLLKQHLVGLGMQFELGKLNEAEAKLRGQGVTITGDAVYVYQYDPAIIDSVMDWIPDFLKVMSNNREMEMEGISATCEKVLTMLRSIPSPNPVTTIDNNLQDTRVMFDGDIGSVREVFESLRTIVLVAAAVRHNQLPEDEQPPTIVFHAG